MDKSNFNQSFFQFIGDTQKVAYDLTMTLQPEGLTNKAFTVLEHLYYVSNLNVKQIADALALSQASTRHILNILLEDKMVYRQKKGRSYSYRLSKKGKVKLDACFFGVVNEIQLKYKNLTEETRVQLMECMNFIAKKMY